MKCPFLRFVVISAFLVSCTDTSHKILHEGAIHYKIAYQGNLGDSLHHFLPTGMRLYFKSNTLRCQLEGGTAILKPIFIINGTQNTFTRIYPNEKLTETRPLLVKDTSLKRINDSSDILGYQCHQYKATNKNASYGIWAAQNMPFHMKGCSRAEGFYLAHYEGLPMRVIDKEQDYTITFEADEVLGKQQPDSLFKTRGDYDNKILRIKK